MIYMGEGAEGGKGFEWKISVGLRPDPPLAEARVTPASYR